MQTQAQFEQMRTRSALRSATTHVNGKRVVASCGYGSFDLYACRKWGKRYWTADNGTTWSPSKSEAVRLAQTGGAS